MCDIWYPVQLFRKLYRQGHGTKCGVGTFRHLARNGDCDSRRGHMINVSSLVSIFTQVLWPVGTVPSGKLLQTVRVRNKNSNSMYQVTP